MEVLIVICSMIVLLVLFLLLAPFYLEIDSEKEILAFKWSPVLFVTVIIMNETIMLQAIIVGFRFNHDLLSKKYKKESKPRTKNSKTSVREFSFRRMINVLKSFKVLRLKLEVDLGDDYWNGILFPLFYLAKVKFNRNIAINFEDRNKFQLLIKNNAANMILAYLK